MKPIYKDGHSDIKLNKALVTPLFREHWWHVFLASGAVWGAGDGNGHGQCLSSGTYWLVENKSMKEQRDVLHIVMNPQSESSMGIVERKTWKEKLMKGVFSDHRTQRPHFADEKSQGWVITPHPIQMTSGRPGAKGRCRLSEGRWLDLWWNAPFSCDEFSRRIYIKNMWV